MVSLDYYFLFTEHKSWPWRLRRTWYVRKNGAFFFKKGLRPVRKQGKYTSLHPIIKNRIMWIVLWSNRTGALRKVWNFLARVQVPTLYHPSFNLGKTSTRVTERAALRSPSPNPRSKTAILPPTRTRHAFNSHPACIQVLENLFNVFLYMFFTSRTRRCALERRTTYLHTQHSNRKLVEIFSTWKKRKASRRLVRIAAFSTNHTSLMTCHA